MVICLKRDADLHMAQLIPLPLTVSCFSKIQIGFTFLVPAHLGSPRKKAVKQVCVCVIVCLFIASRMCFTQLLRVRKVLFCVAAGGCSASELKAMSENEKEDLLVCIF